jgi:alpha-glucosidase
MIDWSNPTAADFWHDFRRAALVQAGVVGHWTDLGEPEDFYAKGWYHGLRPDFGHGHPAVANLYNFAWLESIHRGYLRHEVKRRPFLLSRSGAAGVQRFGAAMWSGDIGSNMVSLRAHIDAQGHVSLSGIDYYGSDVGGFHRHSLDGDVDSLYTRWLACALMTDVPVRPHTMNLERKHETAPDRIGHVPSNLANVKLRYRLRPYLYSLAHQAHRTGEAVFPPLVYHFQRDAKARRITRQKMIGPSLMAALVADHGAIITDVYLPAGTWFNYHSGERHAGGRWLRGLGLSDGDRFRLPLFARAGALIPERDLSHPERLVVRAFPGGRTGETTLYEDDGWSVAYREGALRTTRISRRQEGKKLTITVHPARGTYHDAPGVREVDFRVPGDVKQVKLNGDPVGVGPAGRYTSCRARGVKPDRKTVVEFLFE